MAWENNSTARLLESATFLWLNMLSPCQDCQPSPGLSATPAPGLPINPWRARPSRPATQERGPDFGLVEKKAGRVLRLRASILLLKNFLKWVLELPIPHPTTQQRQSPNLPLDYIFSRPPLPLCWASKAASTRLRTCSFCRILVM